MPEIRLDYDHATFAIKQLEAAGKGINAERAGKVQSVLPTAKRICDILIDIEILLKEYSGLIQFDAKRLQQYADNIKAADESASGGGGFR